MPLLESTKDIQNKLGKYCQTGDATIHVVGARKERLPHYRRLVFNVVLDSLTSAFPLTKKLLGHDRFETLCHDFFSNHACQEAQVYKMTGEFAQYFQQKRDSMLVQEFPFISELLDFEWTEMDMYMMEDIPINREIKDNGDWLYDLIALNPESKLLQYTYPVYKKKPTELDQSDKALYYCYAYRQPGTGKILFLDLSPLVAVIISQVANGHTLSDIFSALLEEGVNMSSVQKERILSFLKAETRNGFSLGFYT